MGHNWRNLFAQYALCIDYLPLILHGERSLHIQGFNEAVLGVTLAFLAPTLYAVVRTTRSKLTVREMRFTALLLFDQEAEHHEPVQMSNYRLSVSANNDWVNVFKGNQQLRQRYLDSEAQQMNPWGYRQDFDYQVQIQYLEYVILREFCDWVRPVDNVPGQELRGIAG